MRSDAAFSCDCHLHEHQVCDVCQGVDPDNPAPDVEPRNAANVRELWDENACSACGRFFTPTLEALLDERDRYREALSEIRRREARSEYSSIYAAPSEFAAVAREALDA